jgi:hypothetical protein
LPVNPKPLRAQYKAAVQAHMDELAKLFRQNQIDYALHNTSQPLDFALFNFLSARERMSRVR